MTFICPPICEKLPYWYSTLVLPFPRCHACSETRPGLRGTVVFQGLAFEESEYHIPMFSVLLSPISFARDVSRWEERLPSYLRRRSMQEFAISFSQSPFSPTTTVLRMCTFIWCCCISNDNILFLFTYIHES